MAKKTPWPKLIRQMRTAKDFSQPEAAEAAGVSESTWQRWERDGFSPSLKQQERIARAFGCTVEELGARFAKEVAKSEKPRGPSEEINDIFDALDQRGVDNTLRAGREMVRLLEEGLRRSEGDLSVEEMLGESRLAKMEEMSGVIHYFVGQGHVAVTGVLQILSEIHAVWPRFEAFGTDGERQNVVRLQSRMRELMHFCMDMTQDLSEILSAANDKFEAELDAEEELLAP